MFTSLFDFAGHEVKLLGQINLPLPLGKKPLRKTRTKTFTVIKVASAYGVAIVELIQGDGINVPSEGQDLSRWTSRRGLRKSSRH